MKQTIQFLAIIMIVACQKLPNAVPVQSGPTYFSSSKLVGTWNTTITCETSANDPTNPSRNIQLIVKPPYNTFKTIISDVGGNNNILLDSILGKEIPGMLISPTQFWFNNPVITYQGSSYLPLPVVGNYGSMQFTTLATLSANGDTITASNSGSVSYCQWYPNEILNTTYFTVKMIRQ